MISISPSPVYSGSCYYQSGAHVHIHEFYQVTVTARCNKCGKSNSESYTLNIDALRIIYITVGVRKCNDLSAELLSLLCSIDSNVT